MGEKMGEEKKELEMKVERLEKGVAELSESSFYLKEDKKRMGR